VKLLIAGGRGLLGNNILPILNNHFDTISLDIEEWDITDRDAGKPIIEQYRPDVLLNLAAMTDVDGCEDRRELAQKVNEEGAGIVAELCREYKIRLVHISTDYVFDGEKTSPYTEDDKPNPKSVYGMTKLSGEKRVIEKHPSPLIIRAQWLYGNGGENFITKVVRIAKERGVVEVVDDQRGTPTYAKDIGEPLKCLIEKAKTGIYHITNSGSCTWFEFAGEIFSQLKLDVQLKPTTSLKLNRKAKRPAYSVFDCTKVQRETGITMRTWQESLQEYLG
jgi:dTDP-4-dehydrorhamnose reductase